MKLLLSCILVLGLYGCATASPISIPTASYSKQYEIAGISMGMNAAQALQILKSNSNYEVSGDEGRFRGSNEKEEISVQTSPNYLGNANERVVVYVEYRIKDETNENIAKLASLIESKYGRSPEHFNSDYKPMTKFWCAHPHQQTSGSKTCSINDGEVLSLYRTKLTLGDYARYEKAKLARDNAAKAVDNPNI